MKIHNIQLETPLDIQSLNLAIGNFDGLHLGHKKIVERLIQESNALNAESAIMSFLPHPRQYFSEKFIYFNIISDSMKIKLLNELGVKHLIFLKFDHSIASLSPQEFIEKILVKKLKIKNLIVGYDFKFGQNREGNVNLLKKKSLIYNFNVDILKPVKSKQTSEIFSSSLIRKYIQEGNFKKVNSYLGRNWSLTGTVVQGDKRASKTNFPTANIIPPDLIHPRKGVYIVKAKFNGNLLNGIANFGQRPTVDGKKLILEVHLFDFNEDIYGKDLTVEFLAFIRDEKKFENFEQLTHQIQKDIQEAKDYHLENYHGI